MTAKFVIEEFLDASKKWAEINRFVDKESAMESLKERAAATESERHLRLFELVAYTLPQNTIVNVVNIIK